MMQNLFDEAMKHFNEPILICFDLGRCVGYYEDDEDCYLLVKFPRKEKLVKCTFVGGYTYLTCLKGQCHVTLITGEECDDFYRLDKLLELNGAPREKHFLCEVNNEKENHEETSEADAR